MMQVAAAIICREGRVLICQRAAGRLAHHWEFPGGKLEHGETLEECIIRECKEELAIDIKIKRIFDQRAFRDSVKEIAFTFFQAELQQGEVRTLREIHEDIAWVAPDELDQYKLCPADRLTAQKLKQHLQ
jgi:8-oxo-dGTP diphosphatase